MRELGLAEQRYQAVLATISDGETVTEYIRRQYSVWIQPQAERLRAE
jgi:hypothetical protein